MTVGKKMLGSKQNDKISTAQKKLCFCCSSCFWYSYLLLFFFFHVSNAGRGYP